MSWTLSMQSLLLVFSLAGQATVSSSLATSAPIRNGDLSELVKTLGELTEGIDKEQDVASKLATDRKAACGEEERRLKAALQQNGHALDDAAQDRKVASAQADEADETLKAVKLKVSSVSEQIDDLTAQLGKERKEAGELSDKAGASMMEIQAAIRQVVLQNQTGKHKRVARQSSALRSQMSDLDKLSSGLSFNRRDEGSDDLPTSFLQSGSLNVLGKHRGAKVDKRSVSALKADMQQLEELEVGVMKDFDKKEADLIDLIKEKHDAMARHEANLGDAETTNADRRWRFAEADRKWTAVNNTLLRDAKLLDRLQRKCSLVATNQQALRRLRLQLSNLYEMPQKILKSLDTTSLLAKDTQVVKPSFVQVASSVRRIADGSRSLSDIMRAALAQGESNEGEGRADVQQVEASSAESAVVQDSNASSSSNAPFDKVTQTIQALIDSMMDQATKETTQHQWCTESQAKNKNERLRAKSEVATTAASISAVKITIEQVKASRDFDTSELKRLDQSKKVAEDEFKFEGKRLVGERKAHEESKQIVTKVMLILNDLCDLQDTKTGQCADADKLLAQSLQKIDELNQASFIYLKAFGELTSAFVTESDNALRETTGNVQRAKGALAHLALAVSQKKADKKSKSQELALINTADAELQKGCGKHVLDNREERMQHREEEVAALKSALSALDGI